MFLPRQWSLRSSGVARRVKSEIERQLIITSILRWGHLSLPLRCGAWRVAGRAWWYGRWRLHP